MVDWSYVNGANSRLGALLQFREAVFQTRASFSAKSRETDSSWLQALSNTLWALGTMQDTKHALRSCSVRLDEATRLVLPP